MYNYTLFVKDSNVILKKLKDLLNKANEIDSEEKFNEVKQNVIGIFHTWATSYAKVVANLYLQGDRSTHLSNLYQKRQKIVKSEGEKSEKLKDLDAQIQKVSNETAKRSKLTSFERYTFIILGEQAIKCLDTIIISSASKDGKSLHISNYAPLWLAINNQSSKGAIRALLSGSEYGNMIDSLNAIKEAGKKYKADSRLKHNFLLKRVGERKKVIDICKQIVAISTDFNNLFSTAKERLPKTSDIIEAPQDLEKKKLKKETEQLSISWNTAENFDFFINFSRHFKENLPKTYNLIKGKNYYEFEKQLQITDCGSAF